MNTTTTTTTTTSSGGRVGAEPAIGNDDMDVATCACHVYDAECALHAAHQAGVEAWITAAADRLHAAIDAYLRALDQHTRHDTPSTLSLPRETGQQ